MIPARVYTASVDSLKDPVLYQKTLMLLPAQRRESAERMKVESGKRLSAGAGLLLMAALADVLTDAPAEEGNEKDPADGKVDQPEAEPAGSLVDRPGAEPAGSLVDQPGAEPAAEESFSDRGFLYQDIQAFSALRFGQGEHGKPYLPDDPQVHFNLSHSGNRVMCAVSAHACGCDVEQISHKKKQIDMVIRCLAESEQRLAAVSAVHFYRIWTLKESILKLSGEGIVIPLNSFEVSLDPPAVRQGFFPEPILLKEYDTLQDEYCCALALSGGELPETMTEVDLGKVLEMC